MRFLTYEASTSLNMFLSTLTAKSRSAESPLLHVASEGLGIKESSIVFSVSPISRFDESHEPIPFVPNGPSVNPDGINARNRFRIIGNVFLVKLSCLDAALWKIGGVSVALRIVQTAQVSAMIPHSTVGWTDQI